MLPPCLFLQALISRPDHRTLTRSPQARSLGTIRDAGADAQLIAPLCEGPDIDRWVDPQPVLQAAKHSPVRIRAEASFHANDTRRQLLEHIFENRSLTFLRNAILPSPPDPTM